MAVRLWMVSWVAAAALGCGAEGATTTRAMEAQGGAGAPALPNAPSAGGGAEAGAGSDATPATPSAGMGGASPAAAAGASASAAAPSDAQGDAPEAGSGAPAEPAASDASNAEAASEAAGSGPSPAGAGGSAAQSAGTPASMPAVDPLQTLFPPADPDRTPSPNNPAECPDVAPDNPWGPCVGVPVYAVCQWGTTYSCICDWIHWICVG